LTWRGEVGAPGGGLRPAADFVPDRPTSRRPNFLVIGAAKSGTSSLHRYLDQHPQVFMTANKEPNHFAFQDGVPVFKGYRRDVMPITRNAVVEPEAYLRLYDGGDGARARAARARSRRSTGRVRPSACTRSIPA
jgi:hypothetical protein